MIDRCLDGLIKEHYANTQNALLLSGARQVGKSYAIRKYGKANYSCFIEINFIEQPQAIQIFRNATSVADLLLRLSTFVQQPLVKGDTLIFLDEVQVYPDILTWIKFLAITPTRWHRYSTMERSWAMKRMEQLWSSLQWRNKLMICAWMDTSSDAMGSSATNSSGSMDSALAMATRCR